MSLRFLALGDSYTIGESVPANERWPNQLAGRLAEKNIQTEVTIIACTGWTTAELWQGIQAAKPEPPYDLVSLLIGVNNQFRGYDIQEYRDEFRFLLQKSIEYADNDPRRVVVLSIPDWSVTPFAADRDRAQISTEIGAFNAVNRLASQQVGACYVDVTPISRLAFNDPTVLVSDNLHPSGIMYAQWADLVLPEAQAALARRPLI
jgi:lysophospholipase L1-like esterase